MKTQDPFIENIDDVDDEVIRRNHAQLDSTRHFEEEDQSPEEIARAVARRHHDRAAPYTGDMKEIPQRLRMPSVHDASLWQVRMKVWHFYFIFQLQVINTNTLSISLGGNVKSPPV